MSRIGKLPIKLPNNVTAEITEGRIKVTGPKGELEHQLSDQVKVSVNDNVIEVTRISDEVEPMKMHGLTRTLINNMVLGVSEGFKKELEIIGIGYRAAVSGSKLTLNLGYSHPIDYVAPQGITISVEKNIVTISGIDKQLVGQVSAEIRAFRKPEPYKGKGVKYVTEQIRRKAGKTGGK